ncbi:tyrosine-type recombinase/integrase [Rhodopirellula sp. JC639]|uniref:tyrosine-type recombinase/integrase n=1 Tax=Stieleria mannarensis TaxID=2755585 RepID=UPI001603AFD7|nr:site-specific integrase [Rhodopirellula sp. JC639]
MRKNKQGDWSISIQSLGLNSTFSTRTKKKVDANRILREIESRVDKVKVDGTHSFHDWSKKDQLTWVKTGKEPRLAQEAITVREACQRFVEFKKGQNRALNTTRGYGFDLAPAKKHFGDLPLKDLTASRLQDWVTVLSKTTITKGANRGKKLSVQTQKVKVGALKRVVRHFQSLGESGLNDRVFDAVTYGVAQPDKLSNLTPWIDFDRRVVELERLGIAQDTEGAFKQIILTESQLKEQLSHLEKSLYIDGTLATIRLYATIYFCCVTGARRSELARVRRRDLILSDDLPLVTLLKRKGRKERDLLLQKVVLPNRIAPILERLLRLLPAEQECIFTSDDDHMTQNGFNERKEAAKANYLSKHLNIALKDTKWEHAAGWHLYRHTFASRLLASGYSKTDVKEIVGWCSDQMAQRYQHHTFDRKAAIANQLASAL